MYKMKKSRLEALEIGRLAYAEKVRKGEVVRLNPLERAKANPNSMRKAIDGNCFDCNGRENWIVRTKYCVIFDCSFWKLRKGGKNITKEMCLAHKVN